MFTLNQSSKAEQNCVTWILTALLFIMELNIFMKTLLMMLKKWLDSSNYDEDDKRPLPISKNNKVIGLFKNELGGKIMNLLDLEKKHIHN